jgi:hypothetical protein
MTVFNDFLSTNAVRPSRPHLSLLVPRFYFLHSPNMSTNQTLSRRPAPFIYVLQPMSVENMPDPIFKDIEQTLSERSPSTNELRFEKCYNLRRALLSSTSLLFCNPVRLNPRTFPS